VKQPLVLKVPLVDSFMLYRIAKQPSEGTFGTKSSFAMEVE